MKIIIQFRKCIKYVFALCYSYTIDPAPRKTYSITDYERQEENKSMFEYTSAFRSSISTLFYQ